MQITKKDIEQIIEERGQLRFSTLMVRFHISSTEAINIVGKYNKTGKNLRVQKNITVVDPIFSTKKEEISSKKENDQEESQTKRFVETESLLAKPVVSRRRRKNEIEGQLSFL